MLKLMTVLAPLLISFGFAVAHAACPDVSGVYEWKLRPEDARKVYRFTIRQSGCDSITFSEWYVRWSDGGEYRAPTDQMRVELIDGQWHGLLKNSWTSDGIEVVRKNAASISAGSCDEHGFWKLNPAHGSLDYVWRDECPGWSSDWHTPETTRGWTGQRNRRLGPAPRAE